MKHLIQVWQVLLLSSLGVVVSSCAAVLPSEVSRSQYPWGTFQQVKKDYDSIEVNKSTLDVLRAKGFNPEVTPNIETLSYLDIISRFSAVDKKDLPVGIKKCIVAQDLCTAYIARPSVSRDKRIGSVTLDLLGFRKETRTTGWKFKAVFVIVDNVVTYKLWSGTADVESYRKKKQPLGPLQSLGNIFSP